MKLMAKVGAVAATMVVALSSIGVAPASAAHYQGGDYGLCIYPSDTSHDGVYVRGYGLGSDTPSHNYYAAARAFVSASSKCVRKTSHIAISKVQVDKVAVRYQGVNYGTVGPVNKGTSSLTVDSLGVRQPPCGQYAQASVRWSVRYADGELFAGYLNSAGFRRC
jgi:hypothetical protein